MPIYEYICLKCRKEHEMLRKFSDPPVAICPSCGGKMEKKLSLSSFQLKGSGWYKDGYSSAPTPKPTEGKETKEPAKKELVPPSQTAPAAQGGDEPRQRQKMKKPDPKRAKVSSRKRASKT